MIMNQRGATYLSPRSSIAPTRARHKKLVALLLGLLSVLLLASTLSFVNNPRAQESSVIPIAPEVFGNFSNSLVAYADECDGDKPGDCDKEGLKKGSKDVKKGTDGFGEQIDIIRKDKNLSKSYCPTVGETNIIGAIARVFWIGYMNCGKEAHVSEDWYEDIWKGRGKTNCGQWGGSPKYPGESKNTIFWHNCDVPNLVTEMFQDLAYLIYAPGFTDAHVNSVQTDNGWFGFSSNTPGLGDNPGEVTQESGARITALEAFGYNLHYTSYRGEWDHIKVMTAARALTNFGFMDRLKLGVQTFFKGIAGGVSAAVNGFLDDLKSGNVVKIITSPLRAIGNFFKGATTTGVNIIIDTSDTNVFATMSWYRPEFGATLYNARQLSQEEISQYVSNQMNKYLATLKPPKAPPPEDLKAVDVPTLNAISKPDPGKCIADWSFKEKVPVLDANGLPVLDSEGNPTYTTKTQSGRVNEADEYAGSASECNDLINSNKVPKEGGTIVAGSWKVENKVYIKQKTVGEWNAEAGWRGPAEKYQIYCSIDESYDDSFDASIVDVFLDCWEDDEIGYPAAEDRETRNEQTRLDNLYFTQTLTCQFAFFGNCKKEQEKVDKLKSLIADFASPTQKYICLNADGTDRKKNNSDSFVKLIVGKGKDMKYNPECLINGENPVRPAVQNGFFGNGYEKENNAPVDTRRTAFNPSILDLITVDDKISGAGLGVSMFTTRLSNTVLNLAFSPILETIGAADIISALLEGFRDSLFFPFAALIIAFGAFTIFWKAGVSRDYGAQGKALLLIVGVFFLGAVLMANPAKTIKFADDIPAKAEAAITGAIFNPGSSGSDNLCNASTTAAGGTDFFGNTIQYDPAASSRNMLCENWRVFALTPYVYGQWGTSYENLDLNNFHATGSRAVLVESGPGGNQVAPTVQLGSNNQEKNWALYQVDLLTAGTVTTYDPNSVQKVPADLYRLVDLQAGFDYNGNGWPDNGDASYFEAWRGDNPLQRMFVSSLGALTSIVGMVTIILFSFAKIQISLMGMLLLLFMPIMFLIGLIPGQGTYKLKGYAAQIISLMAQRIALAAMIALLLKIVTEISKSTDNFFQYAIITIATCLAFLLQRKRLLDLFDKGITSSTGGFGKGGLSEYMPRRVRQKMEAGRSASKAAVTGAIGGAAFGGISGAIGAARTELNRAKLVSSNKAAMEGFGAASTLLQARRDGKDAARKDIDEYMQDKFSSTAASIADARLASNRKFNDPNTSNAERQRMRAAEMAAATSSLGPRNKGQRTAVRKAARNEARLNKPLDARDDGQLLAQARAAGKAFDGSGINSDLGDRSGDTRDVRRHQESTRKVADMIEGNRKRSETKDNLVREAKDKLHDTAVHVGKQTAAAGRTAAAGASVAGNMAGEALGVTSADAAKAKERYHAAREEQFDNASDFVRASIENSEDNARERALIADASAKLAESFKQSNMEGVKLNAKGEREVAQQDFFKAQREQYDREVAQQGAKHAEKIAKQKLEAAEEFKKAYLETIEEGRKQIKPDSPDLDLFNDKALADIELMDHNIDDLREFLAGAMKNTDKKSALLGEAQLKTRSNKANVATAKEKEKAARLAEAEQELKQARAQEKAEKTLKEEEKQKKNEALGLRGDAKALIDERVKENKEALKGGKPFKGDAAKALADHGAKAREETKEQKQKIADDKKAQAKKDARQEELKKLKDFNVTPEEQIQVNQAKSDVDQLNEESQKTKSGPSAGDVLEGAWGKKAWAVTGQLSNETMENYLSPEFLQGETQGPGIRGIRESIQQERSRLMDKAREMHDAGEDTSEIESVISSLEDFDKSW